ncbi:MAG: hypothetical protein ACRCUY_09210 [Thermoguttaceae bacterium]
MTIIQLRRSSGATKPANLRWRLAGIHRWNTPPEYTADLRRRLAKTQWLETLAARRKTIIFQCVVSAQIY